MAINIEALINSLGMNYQYILDAKLIPYKTQPTGYSGDPDITLNMAKEGVHLAFKRDGKILYAISLVLINEKNSKYRFPNELPSPLIPDMNRQWVHQQLGEPEKSLPPRKRLSKFVGWTELYTLLDFHLPMSMQISYDLLERAKTVTFLPTSEVRW